MSDTVIESFLYFPSVLYTVEKPEFLDKAKEASLEYLRDARKNPDFNKIYPLYNTDDLRNDDRVEDLARFILDTSWHILDSQGYNMDGFVTVLNDFWCQEHLKTSGHERHMHHSIVTGFYFLDCPDRCCKLSIHDPRNIKEFLNLPEKDMMEVTHATNRIEFVPKPGTLIFSNSWLPHSFTRNESDQPFRFIHFNVAIQTAEHQHTAEVI